ncbi:hypothetical protein ILUMI_15376 [Ignelater luminosus]|uniref:Uncharacterized protein n=1 Tax=Ignelater luminosus TaxID=2038154 RepID=A0A8K0CUU0_IGNLU|nr:hypothetical protein ILUMI_15376 [Ignelater luminosus]
MQHIFCHVSFFRPIKNHWKQLLHEWKKSNPSPSSVKKSLCPRSLQKVFGVMLQLKEKSKIQISKRRIFEENEESSEAETNVSEESDEGE